LLYSREVVADLAQTEDFKEGVQAFVEKRKASWVNR
jgi:enoyl-CoA hydratase/carnithine racemase